MAGHLLKKNRGHQGFTLVEILVVIVVLGIIASIGVTVFQDNIFLRHMKRRWKLPNGFSQQPFTLPYWMDTS